MDRAEAARILHKHLDELEVLGYAELSSRIGHDEVLTITGSSGHEYQIEVTILWDRDPGGAIRILGGIDDGGLSAFLPLSAGRLIDPQSKPAGP
jgi:hypothetical protein